MKFRSEDFKNKYDMIVIGCSAGGIEALKLILSEFSDSFKLPIVIVQHRSAQSPAVFLKYFSEICDLPIIEPEDKEPIQIKTIYFAPANYHLLIGSDKCFNLSVDEAVQFSRPSIDVLFSSAAGVYKNRLVGIVLSGANADGANGLLNIKRSGGLTIAQDPKHAAYSEMPAAAVEICKPDLVLRLKDIKTLIHGI
jgi:two-component system, chemotaxis family, protein-glutamate methylesterase/glutaminase